MRNLPKSVQNRCPRPSWRGLGAILAPRGPKTSQKRRPAKLTKGFWRPKSVQNSIKSMETSIQQLINVSTYFLIDFVPILGGFGRPKSMKNEEEMEARMQSTCRHNFISFLVQLLVDLRTSEPSFFDDTPMRNACF